MFPRLIATTTAIALVAASLLALRQHRLQLLHAMGELHVQMDTDRKLTWDTQSAIAEGTHPAALRDAVIRVGLKLKPADAPTPAAP
ncbi:MAG: hypothetical protein V3V20_01860 [Algisphaera sp.]